MKFVSKTIILIFCLLTAMSATLRAQEMLTGVTRNAVIAKAAAKSQPTRDITTPVKLPFIEDFSTGVGYPNPNYWTDRQAFVNNSYPIYPPSIGVATLDALDENGRIYAHADL